ncbi:MAG TPA: EscU/YscU/HrcU family type III secretion system export apparatus switch protein [Gammaproteobacteria bacterium]|nr:EscU/YscU/HrcU family type III secretion system export apparatus switch protein [Gammaproteobacteria bacterium]
MSDDSGDGESGQRAGDGARRAVAVRYQAQENNAPVVTAKGYGTLAERLLNQAADTGVPVREDHFLVEVLSRLDVGAEIPPETYEAMAIILAEIYRLDRQAED